MDLPLLALAALPCALQGPGVHDLEGPVSQELELRSTWSPGLSKDEALALAYAPDGARLFVSGTHKYSSNTLIWTVCYDTLTGAPLWQSSWEGIPPENAYPRGLCAAPDGERLWVSGDTGDSGEDRLVRIFAYDAVQGGELWIYTFGTPGLDWAASNVVASDDGSTLFMGMSGGSEARLAAIDGVSGGERWVATTTLGPVGGDLRAVSLVPGAPRIAAVGEWVAMDGLFYDYEALVTLHRTTTGEELWTAHFDHPGDGDLGGGPDDDRFVDVAVAPDGHSVAACGQADAFPAQDFLVALLDTQDGALLWSDTVSHGTYDTALDCAWSPDGAALYACGDLDGEFAAVAYDAATGAQRWLHTLSPKNGTAVSIAVTPDGQRVIAAGPVAGDYVTVAWDAATGEEIWRAVYDSGFGGGDSTNALALAPDGSHAAVTGWSETPFDAADFLTVQYGLFPTADVVDLGGGCPGSLGLPSLAATTPLLGEKLELTLSAAPAAAPALLLAAPATAAIDLAGCALVVDPAGASLFPALTGVGGEAAWAVSVPLAPALAGLSVALQAGALDAAAPWPSLAVAPGIEIMLGG